MPTRLSDSEKFKHSNMRVFSVSSVIVILFTLTGCETWNAENAARPDVAPPSEWSAPFDASSDSKEPVNGWLDDFASAELEGLVDEALAGNPSLLSALASLDAAYYNAKIAGARLYPSIGLDGSLRRARSNTATGNRIYSNSGSVSAGVSWEVDLWGRVRDGKRAAEEDFAASEAAYAGARLSLVANVTRLWIRAIAAKQQLDLAERTLASYEDNVEIVQSRFEQGISTALDLQLIRSTAASTTEAPWPEQGHAR